MTLHQLADTHTRLGEALRRLPDEPIFIKQPKLTGEYAVGAALFWSYLRDLVTAAERDSFTREELLVLLEVVSRDAELFPPGLFEAVANSGEERA
jgi:hypothetical protein